jgi:NADPH2:quinone reductase
MLFDNVTIRLLGSDDFPTAAKRQAATDLTTAAREGKLTVPVGEPFDLADAAKAHDGVDRGARERVLLRIPRS